MVPQKTTTEDGASVKKVNDILQNLRGEHFRHTRNVHGKPVSSSSLSSHSHNQPTLPVNLIYSSPVPPTRLSWTPGPSPPRSWRTPSSPPLPKGDAGGASTAAWRERALWPLFSAGVMPSSCLPESTPARQIYPDSSPIPRLTLLCIQLIRSACPVTDFAEIVPYIPLHLRRALLRYAAVHAPLSQTELDVLCAGTTHIDTELIVIGPYNTLRASSFRRIDHIPHLGGEEFGGSWDAIPTQDSESLALRSLAVLSSTLSAATMLAFPPTITRLVLVGIPHRISLPRLTTICPLLVFLDLSYNAWLIVQDADGGTPVLEQVEWAKWRRLEILGLRECIVTPKVLLELNRGRWEDVTIIQ